MGNLSGKHSSHGTNKKSKGGHDQKHQSRDVSKNKNVNDYSAKEKHNQNGFLNIKKQSKNSDPPYIIESFHAANVKDKRTDLNGRLVQSIGTGLDAIPKTQGNIRKLSSDGRSQSMSDLDSNDVSILPDPYMTNDNVYSKPFKFKSNSVVRQSYENIKQSADNVGDSREHTLETLTYDSDDNDAKPITIVFNKVIKQYPSDNEKVRDIEKPKRSIDHGSDKAPSSSLTSSDENASKNTNNTADSNSSNISSFAPPSTSSSWGDVKPIPEGKLGFLPKIPDSHNDDASSFCSVTTLDNMTESMAPTEVMSNVDNIKHSELRKMKKTDNSDLSGYDSDVTLTSAHDNSFDSDCSSVSNPRHAHKKLSPDKSVQVNIGSKESNFTTVLKIGNSEDISPEPEPMEVKSRFTWSENKTKGTERPRTLSQMSLFLSSAGKSNLQNTPNNADVDNTAQIYQYITDQKHLKQQIKKPNPPADPLIVNGEVSAYVPLTVSKEPVSNSNSFPEENSIKKNGNKLQNVVVKSDTNRLSYRKSNPVLANSYDSNVISENESSPIISVPKVVEAKSDPTVDRKDSVPAYGYQLNYNAYSRALKKTMSNEPIKENPMEIQFNESIKNESTKDSDLNHNTYDGLNDDKNVPQIHEHQDDCETYSKVLKKETRFPNNENQENRAMGKDDDLTIENQPNYSANSKALNHTTSEPIDLNKRVINEDVDDDQVSFRKRKTVVLHHERPEIYKKESPVESSLLRSDSKSVHGSTDATNKIKALQGILLNQANPFSQIVPSRLPPTVSAAVSDLNTTRHNTGSGNYAANRNSYRENNSLSQEKTSNSKQNSPIGPVSTNMVRTDSIKPHATNEDDIIKTGLETRPRENDDSSVQYTRRRKSDIKLMLEEKFKHFSNTLPAPNKTKSNFKFDGSIRAGNINSNSLKNDLNKNSETEIISPDEHDSVKLSDQFSSNDSSPNQTVSIKERQKAFNKSPSFISDLQQQKSILHKVSSVNERRNQYGKIPTNSLIQKKDPNEQTDYRSKSEKASSSSPETVNSTPFHSDNSLTDHGRSDTATAASTNTKGFIDDGSSNTIKSSSIMVKVENEKKNEKVDSSLQRKVSEIHKMFEKNSQQNQKILETRTSFRTSSALNK